jgi:valyl-tRNA synthetase
VEGFDPQAVRGTLNRWALGEAARAVDEVTAGIVAYRFNEAAGAAYRFVWNVFCDWYLELAKPVLQGADGPEKDEARATTAYLIDLICKLLHPFMPFLTEELWAAKGAEGPARDEPLLALAAWPAAGLLRDGAAEAEIGWVVDLVTEIRSARQETNVPAGAQIPLQLVGASLETRDRADRWGDVLRRLARLSDVTFVEAAPRASVQIIVRGETAALPLEGVVDVAAEVARLTKEKGRLAGDVAKIDGKLANADFLARAPEEVVEEQRERREEMLARIAKIDEALRRLQG